jgi:hypothetical protein
MNKLYAALLATCAILLTGCGTTFESQSQETRVVVTPATSADLYIVVAKPISDTDDSYDPSQGIVLPLGKYTLESEDINYWYFRSKKPLVLALYEFGQQSSGMRLNGGVALSKTGDHSKPTPCAYADDAGRNGKILVWKMSKEFMKNRGSKWRLSSDAPFPSTFVQPAPAESKPSAK